MARLALKLKAERFKKDHFAAVAKGNDVKKRLFSSKVYNRCKRCGRVKGYMRKFELCRICFRELANQGLIMGIRKSSW
ncbi:MAG: type Z 30S ribosomal protein S14 [Patescibacteria group bacterium]